MFDPALDSPDPLPEVNLLTWTLDHDLNLRGQPLTLPFRPDLPVFELPEWHLPEKTCSDAVLAVERLSTPPNCNEIVFFKQYLQSTKL